MKGSIIALSADLRSVVRLSNGRIIIVAADRRSGIIVPSDRSANADEIFSFSGDLLSSCDLLTR